MSFMEATSLKGEFQSQDAPVYHIVPYITGGLNTLFNRIKTESVPELADYGYHTNREGHFEPVGECLMGLRYHVKQKLDTKGHSAVLVVAEDLFAQKKLVVIKVLHSHFYKLGSQESHILWKLSVADPLNHSHTLRLLTTLTFDSHFCMVFEPLLPEPLTNIFQEFSTHRVVPNLRKVGLRLLATIGFLHQQNMIHTDLKPENILLKHESDLDSVHIVDFGNTVNYVHKEISLYYNDFELQTPLYRAPEVIFGLPFGTEIDMWSLGCILAELYTGEPLFYGINKEEIVKQITKLLGPFPAAVFKRGKFFEELKQYTSTEDNSVQAVSVLMDRLQCRDVAFVELLSGLLCYNPDERLTAKEAACHPFFASYFPVGFLLGDTSAVTHYSSNHISHKSYIHSPQVSSSIKKKQPSSRDLLKLGTTESSPCKTNTGVIKPKPIELLNQRRKLLIRKSGDKTQTERRKLLTKKSTDKAETFNEIDSVVMNEEYVDALTKAKNKDKLSDNVKEKMSSLLKAIKDEQSLVENDMERKSKEITLKEDRFSLSSGNKRQCENTLRPHRNEVVEGSNKVVDRKVENDKILKPDTLRKTEILDVVHDTKHTTNQSADNNEYIRIKEHQSQSLSMHAEGRFDQKHGRQTYQMSKMIEDKHRSGKTNNDHAHFIRDKSTSRNTSTTSSKSSHSELMSDSVEVEFMNAQNASTATDINYSQRGSKVDKQTFGSHKKHVPRQPTDRQMAHDTDNNVSVMFEQMYSEVITPKRNKYPSSDENEYVDIISPFDRMSASKRQISERKRGLISSSKKKIESPSYKPVRPKAVVKPDSWRQSISTEKNDNHALERQNKAASSETVEFSAECQDNYSDSEDVDSDIEVIPDKRENTDVDTSQYSVGRKSFDKASESIRNLKHNETKMTGYNHYVDKKRVSEHGRHRSGIVTENENPKVDLQSLDRRNIRTDQSSQSSSNRNSSYHDDLETSKRIRQSIGPSKGLNTQDVISRKERLVFARRSAMPDTEEQTLTPIPKAMAQSVPSNVSDSPEIVYRLKEGLNDGNKWKASQAQNQIPQECEKDDSTQRNQKQRKSVGRHVHKSRSSNVANTNLDLVKFRTIRRSTGADDYNLCNSVDTNQSTGHDDPFEFSGTPGSTMKKVNIQGIGERIEQKRSKVKKKARKSLLFEQQDTDEDCCESDNSQSVCSSDTQHDTYGERNDRNSGDRLEKRKVMDQKYHNVIQNSTPVVMNKGQEFHNRKRPLSDDLGVNPADFIMAEKKHKPLIGQTVHKTFDAVVKKPKLSQAFDTTFTIDSNRLKQKHTKGPFK